MTGDPSNVRIREAAHTDLPRLGRLGALLVQEHHDFDRRRFLAAKSRTPQDYAAFLGTRLHDRDAVILVAKSNGETLGYAYGEIEGYDYMSLRGPAGVLNDLYCGSRVPWPRRGALAARRNRFTSGSRYICVCSRQLFWMYGTNNGPNLIKPLKPLRNAST